MRGAFILDCDDVAVPFVPGFLEHVRAHFPHISDPYEARTGQKLDVKVFNPFGLKAVTGCSPEDEKAAVLHFYESRAFMDLPMADGAAEALAEINGLGHPVYVATSRPGRLRDLTRQVFERHIPGIVTDYFFAGGQVISTSALTKGGICREHGAAYFVDDSDHHITSCLAESEGTRAIVFSAPWNVGYLDPRAHRHETWQEILDMVRSNGHYHSE